MKKFYCALFILALAIVLASCGPADKLWPSDRIGPMWVNRYGHSNSQDIWGFCDGSMPAEPGTRTVECSVPWVDELFIGDGIVAPTPELRDALWNARTWDLNIDGYAVDLPAFNIADWSGEAGGGHYEFRVWRIRLRKIPAGLHTLQYVMHVNEEVEGDPNSQAPGDYELIVKFTFEEK